MINKQSHKKEISIESFLQSSAKFFNNPTRIFLSVVVLVFLSEAIVMLILAKLPLLPILEEALLDALLLTLILLPLLFFLIYKPLRLYLTEREKAMEALRRSEKRFRDITENTVEWIWEVDTQGKYTYASPVVEKILGYKSEEVLMKHFYDLFHPEDREELKAKAFEIFAAKVPFQEFINRNMHKEGNIVWLSTSGIPILDEAGKLLGYRGSDINITERKKAEDKIQASLKEKEVLLQEIHHRVKNNMQIISSLLRLQSRQTDEKKEVDMLLESQNRIRSMALIHEKLYQSEDLAHVDFNEYIRDLTKGLFRSYRAGTDKIVFRADLEDALIGIDTAIPCGLIVNELVSNALKHAFPGGRKGEIQIGFRRIGDLESGIQHENSEMFELKVRDNGIGMPQDMDFRNTESLGLRLVSTLSENQLQGAIHLTGRGGTEFQIRFKDIGYRGGI
jgi:PAS domain S-box-containing protein